jgi:hypothetical protein
MGGRIEATDETMARRLRLGHQAQIGDARSPEGRSQPLLGERGRQKFDAAKIAFVGNANKEVFMCAVRAVAR